ncbi:vWA domain-containing protein [Lacticaseibacillus yichunensis]|uniref:SpaA isopeptide-forming pilin-related protein n=1 Tax=Lacticaseibacillus yichunensis TaxID=2486015 RepID=A0ABW4CN68_9LACO|nr:vWA domain-containing protein [Lacticaseibacillus yichunensis]
MTKKIVHGVMVLILLLVQLQSLVTARVAQASSGSSTVSQSIIANDDLSMTVDGVTSGETIEWTVTYEKKAAGYDRALKLRVSANENFDTQLTPIGQTAFHRMQAQGDDPDQQWWIEKEYAQSGNGTVKFTTPRAQNTVYVAAQLSQTTDDGNTDVLTGVDAAAHKVTLDTSVVDVPAEEVDVPATEEEAAVTETAPEANPSQTDTTDQTATTPAASEEESSLKVDESHQITSFLSWSGLSRVSGSASTNDPFTYTSVGNDSRYPSHGTSISDDSTYVNYNYGLKNPERYAEVSPTTDVTLNMDTGYHKYTDGDMTVGYTKKTVSATDDLDTFKVQLDMIGEQIQPVPKVDIVMVLDHSNSMTFKDDEDDRGNAIGDTRWQKLVKAVDTFADSVLGTNNNVQMGMVSFAEVDSRSYAEIGSFTSLNNNGKFTGFTTDAATFKNHRLLDAPAYANTPTFLGVDAGLHLLSNEDMGARDDARKVLITVTDGEPNRQASSSYYGSYNNLNSLTASFLNTNKVSQSISQNGYARKYTAATTQVSTTSTVTGTVNFINSRLDQFTNVSSWAIGLYTNTDADKVLDALGPEKQNFKAEQVHELEEALHLISAPFMKTICDATVVDPMSDYVTLQTGSVRSYRLTVGDTGIPLQQTITQSDNDYAAQINVQTSSNQINLSNVWLGRNNGTLQGYRITYEVKLKSEYQDGLFYPTNKSTYLTNNAEDTADHLHFAVPSVRLKSERDLVVKKDWINDDENANGLRQDVKMVLQRKNASGWENVKSETLSTSNNWTHTFTNLPRYEDGKLIEYQVVEKVVIDGVEKDRVPGYYAPTYSTRTEDGVVTWIVKNELKTIDFGFTKYRVDTNTTWSGIRFTLISQSNPQIEKNAYSLDKGRVDFSGLSAGIYTLIEEAPTGIKPVAHTVFVTDTEDGLSVTSTLGPDNQFINEFKNYELTFIKTDSETGAALEGAKFALKQDGDTLEETATGSDGKIVFTHELAPGDYVLEETEVPAGYLQLDEDIHFTVNNNGTVTLTAYTGSDSADVKVKLGYTMQGGDTLNKVTITASNIPEREILPRTGGPGIWGYIALATSLVFLAGGLMVHNRKSVKEGQ